MMSSFFPARSDYNASETFSKLEPVRFSQNHLPASRNDRGLLALRIFQSVEPHQRQGMAVLSRGKGSELAPFRLERRAKRNLAKDVHDEEALARSGPMFHACRHFLPHVTAFSETDAFEFFESCIQREDLVG